MNNRIFSTKEARMMRHLNSPPARPHHILQIKLVCDKKKTIMMHLQFF